MKKETKKTLIIIGIVLLVLYGFNNQGFTGSAVNIEDNCGNGIKDIGEECDEGTSFGAFCNNDCTLWGGFQ